MLVYHPFHAWCNVGLGNVLAQDYSLVQTLKENKKEKQLFSNIIFFNVFSIEYIVSATLTQK